LATIVLRKDEKEVDPGVARAIVFKLRQRLEKEALDATSFWRPCSG
jgi:hypothetical protein